MNILRFHDQRFGRWQSALTGACSLLLMLSVESVSAIDYSKFRPLDQSEPAYPGFPPQPQHGYPGGASGYGQYPNQAAENPYAPRYRFRELDKETDNQKRGPQFRSDPRLDKRRGDDGRPVQRWTGNDHRLQQSPSTQPQQSESTGYLPYYQNYYSPSYPYSGYHYYPDNRWNFPWSGFMPSFSW